MKIYDRYNFYKNTFCEFHALTEVEIPDSDPDFISKSQSRYYFSEQGVIRISNHWGRAAKCKWRLLGAGSKNRLKAGYAKWSDFLEDIPDAKIYWIQGSDKNQNYKYMHKDSPEYSGEMLRREKDTIKAIRKLRGH